MIGLNLLELILHPHAPSVMASQRQSHIFSSLASLHLGYMNGSSMQLRLKFHHHSHLYQFGVVLLPPRTFQLKQGLGVIILKNLFVRWNQMHDTRPCMETIISSFNEESSISLSKMRSPFKNSVFGNILCLLNPHIDTNLNPGNQLCLFQACLFLLFSSVAFFPCFFSFYSFALYRLLHKGRTQKNFFGGH